MKKKASTEAMENRYTRLTARLARLGPVLQGTITGRSIIRRVAGQEKIYGPYHQWTFKRKGKTVTVNLTATQAKRYQRAIGNHRKLEGILDEMRVLSQEILEAREPGVIKRKPRA